jgi:16S rRNA (uracil1498-N3)-methyltransferase
VEDPAHPTLTGADAHHLERVLRLQPGEAVVTTDGRGDWTISRYLGARRLEPEGPVVHEPAPDPPVTVAFVPVKGERSEWVVQKLTELGVDRIVVMTSARSVVRWVGQRERAAMERLRRVAAEAAAQSRRVRLPEVEGVLPLQAAGHLHLALAEPGAPPLAQGCSGVAVGPEGGWADSELALGWPTVGLGQHVLRAETAAVAAGVLLTATRAGTV